MEKNPVDNEIFLVEGQGYIVSLVAGHHPKDSAVIFGTLILESASSLVIRDDTGEQPEDYLIYKSSIRYVQKLEE